MSETDGERPVVLLLGFASSPSGPPDPSGSLLPLVADNAPAGAELRIQVLPPDPEGALLKAIEAMDRLLPDAVLGLGAGDSPAALTVERVALNLDDRGRGDAHARIEAIDAAGPAAYFSTLPVHVMVERMQAGGVPAIVSNSAGTQICNRLFYALLHYVALRGEETWFKRKPPAGLASRVGFIRLPGRAPGRSARGRLGHLPDLEGSLTGVLLAVESVIDFLATAEAHAADATTARD